MAPVDKSFTITDKGCTTKLLLTAIYSYDRKDYRRASRNVRCSDVGTLTPRILSRPTKAQPSLSPVSAFSFRDYDRPRRAVTGGSAFGGG